MKAVLLPYVQNTPEWEEARRDLIGSSDLPVITGSAPYSGSSLFDLWALKTRRIDAVPVDEATQELFDLGHALEPVIAARYTALSDRPLRRVRRMLRHPDIEWAAASLDRVSAVKGERLIVECKWDPWSRFGRSVEEVPPHVQDQVQWQLFVSGYEAAEVAVLMGARVSRLEVTPDKAYQDDLLYLAQQFRQHHILGDEPPEPDGSEATRKAIARLHPDDTADFMDPTAEIHALMRNLQPAMRAEKDAAAEVGRIRNALRLALGDHSGAECADWRVTFRRGKPRHTTDWKAVAEAHAHRFTVAGARAGVPEAKTRGYLDAIQAKHTTTTDGTRPLNPRWAKEGETWT